MNLNAIVQNALRPLIADGLIAEVHTSPHARFVEGGIIPDEVNVVAVLTTLTPEDHRLSIESLLHNAGLRRAVLILREQTTPQRQPPAQSAGHATIPSDLTGDAERRVRERAYLLWELEGKPDGRLDEYWDRACELIQDETQSSYPPTQSRGHRT